MEARYPDLEYQDNEQQVIAVLKSYNSQVYTKLAQKVERIDQLEAEIIYTVNSGTNYCFRKSQKAIGHCNTKITIVTYPIC